MSFISRTASTGPFRDSHTTTVKQPPNTICGVTASAIDEEVVKKCLPALGLSDSWLYHGIKREAFVVPLARNTREFLRGQHVRLAWYHQSEFDIFEYFRDRWMIPRSAWDRRFASWSNTTWRLWPNSVPACRD